MQCGVGGKAGVRKIRDAGAMNQVKGWEEAELGQ